MLQTNVSMYDSDNFKKLPKGNKYNESVLLRKFMKFLLKFP
jgi:hypothetical protein